MSGGVVPASDRPELGGARHVGAVHALAQRAVVRVLHDRQVRGHVQRELPAAPCRRPSPPSAAVSSTSSGMPRPLVGIGVEVREGVGRVEHVVAEARGQFGRASRPAALNARLLVVGQLGAAEPEVAQLVLDDASAARRRAPANAGEARIALYLRNSPSCCDELGAVLRDLRQVRVVDLAQLRAFITAFSARPGPRRGRGARWRPRGAGRNRPRRCGARVVRERARSARGSRRATGRRRGATCSALNSAKRGSPEKSSNGFMDFPFEWDEKLRRRVTRYADSRARVPAGSAS